MLNQNVTKVLSTIDKITNQLVLKYPTTVINSPASDIMVSIDIASLDPEEFEEIGIYDLSEFLGTFNLFGADREVRVSDRVIQITEGNFDAEYVSSKISLLTEHNKSVSVFDTTDSVPSVAEFVLSAEEMKKIKQAAGLYKDLSEVIITSQDGEVSVSLGASNKFNARSNKVNIRKEASTTKEFTIKIPVENYNMLPVSEYTFYVKYNSAKNAYRIMMKSNELKDFKIIMTVKK